MDLRHLENSLCSTVLDLLPSYVYLAEATIRNKKFTPI